VFGKGRGEKGGERYLGVFEWNFGVSYREVRLLQLRLSVRRIAMIVRMELRAPRSHVSGTERLPWNYVTRLFHGMLSAPVSWPETTQRGLFGDRAAEVDLVEQLRHFAKPGYPKTFR